jgi:hypothetical protein
MHEMTVIPLPEAAQRLGIAPEVLTHLVQSDKIRVRSVKTGDGQVMLSEGDVQRMAKAKALRDRIWQKVAHLEKNRIGIREARELYGIPDQTIAHGIREGYIRDEGASGTGRGNKHLVYESDIAYAAELKRVLGGGRGHRIFGPDTIPPHALEASMA